MTRQPIEAHTYRAKIAAGFYPSPGGHATVSDGERALVICDLGGSIDLGGVNADADTLDQLADYAKTAAQRLRERGQG